MDEFAKKALQCHNECRKLHQVPSLRWAADLASEAQEWANKIARANNLQHASKSERKDSGENIAMFSGRFDTAAEQATGMWYSEVSKYNFEKPSFQPGTGHFTQRTNQSSLRLVFQSFNMQFADYNFASYSWFAVDVMTTRLEES